LPVKLLNVDLSTVTTAADLVLGLGDPPEEVVHIDFQSRAAAWKHADLMAYNALLFAHYHVPVHTIILLLQPGVAHSNMNGVIRYAPRPGRVAWTSAMRSSPCGSAPPRTCWRRTWRRPAGGPRPLAGGPVAGGRPDRRRPPARERLTREAPPDRAKKLLTDALLLAGLRVRRDVAARIFRGVRAMEESDTYLAIIDEGRERGIRDLILIQGTDRFGPPDEAVKARLGTITDVDRLMRMGRQTLKASSWQEILDTP